MKTFLLKKACLCLCIFCTSSILCAQIVFDFSGVSISSSTATVTTIVGIDTYVMTVNSNRNLASDNGNGADASSYTIIYPTLAGAHQLDFTFTKNTEPVTSFDLDGIFINDFFNSSEDVTFSNNLGGSTIRSSEPARVITDLTYTGISSFTVNATSDQPEFGEVTISNAVALPVNLTNFHAKPAHNSVELTWLTEAEFNNDYFYLQKSTDNRNFQEVAIVQGAGTTYEAQDYSYLDERPANGVNYYRLKQVDYDGQFAYSEIISVNFKSDSDISITPNPVKDRLNIANAEKWKGTVDLLVFAVNGQVVQRAQYDNPDQSIALDIQDLRAGMYHVQIISNNQTIIQRFVKN